MHSLDATLTVPVARHSAHADGIRLFRELVGTIWTHTVTALRTLGTLPRDVPSPRAHTPVLAFPTATLSGQSIQSP